MEQGPSVALSEIEETFRAVYGHAVATLVRVFGDIAAAEDAVQDAFVVASRRWPADGVPPNPAGWIVTTARRRAIDQARRSTRGRELERTSVEHSILHLDQIDHGEEVGPVDDDRLRLMFTCCHPALRVEHQVALTLRLLGGLTVEEIAAGFLVSEAAMAKRLTRAKFKISAAKIPYRVPARADLSARLRPVLSVLYLIYNAGADDLIERASLRVEAIRLTRSLVRLLPDEPEAAGLLALMVLTESRVPARRVIDSVVLLRDQDRATWDGSLIAEGHAIVTRCIELGRPGPFQLQAAINAVHCDAPTFEATDWQQILALYDHLYRLMPSPVVALNRAIAFAETTGVAEALALVDGLESALDIYCPFHASRADLLRRLGRLVEAREAFERALDLATVDADRDYFRSQVAHLASGGKI